MAEPDVEGFRQLAADRRAGIEALKRNGWDEGFRRLLTELYPDNAHFVFELLQNAEDARATQVWFELDRFSLIFRHNGSRQFSLDDIESITSIGVSTKREDETAIGRFGVGFKAVFAYTNRPEVRSGGYSFAIEELLVPVACSDSTSSSWATETWFRFPFDHADKSREAAFSEVQDALLGLEGSSLLFLSSIRRVDFSVAGGESGFVERNDLGDSVLELRRGAEGSEEVTHWLRIQQTVSIEGLVAERTVAAAFSLEKRASGQPAPKTGPAGTAQWRVQPLDEGDVCIFFPAASVRSGLRFHIHAPFASTVARDAIRDVPENHAYVEQIAAMLADSLPGWRDAGYLDDGLLAALPNHNDLLHPAYSVVRDRILAKFASDPLVPVHGGGFALSSEAVLSPSYFRRALTEADLPDLLALLEGDPPQARLRWARSFGGRDRRVRWLLASLDIRAFQPSEVDRLIRGFIDSRINAHRWRAMIGIAERAGGGTARVATEQRPRELGPEFLNWLTSLPPERIKPVYAWLGRVLDDLGKDAGAARTFWRRAFADLRVVLTRDPAVPWRTPAEAYLPVEATDVSPQLVAAEILTEPRSDDDASASADEPHIERFLETIGVERWDASAKVATMLARYKEGVVATPTRDDYLPPPYAEDIRHFMHYVEEDGNAARLFAGVPFLLADDGTSLRWVSADRLFLDRPLVETGLRDAFDELGSKGPVAGLLPVWGEYADEFNDDLESLAGFMMRLGALGTVPIDRVKVGTNPEFNRRWRWAGTETSYKTDRDYAIRGWHLWGANASARYLRALWEMLISDGSAQGYLRATYSRNKSADVHTFNSQLVHQLASEPWVPLRHGRRVLPRDALPQELDDGFDYVPGSQLLEAIGFGSAHKQRLEDEQRNRQTVQDAAETLGLDPDLAIKMGKMSAAEQQEMYWTYQTRKTSADAEMPGSVVEDPERRGKRIDELNMDADTTRSRKRVRRVKPQQKRNIQEAKAYLRSEYGPEGRVRCQWCRQRMPFQVNEQDYFHAVDYIKGPKIYAKHSRLALCPVCAAKFRHANDMANEERNRRMLDALRAGRAADHIEVPLTLAGEEGLLYFTGKHAFDLGRFLMMDQPSVGVNHGDEGDEDELEDED